MLTCFYPPIARLSNDNFALIRRGTANFNTDTFTFVPVLFSFVLAVMMMVMMMLLLLLLLILMVLLPLLLLLLLLLVRLFFRVILVPGPSFTNSRETLIATALTTERRGG